MALLLGAQAGCATTVEADPADSRSRPRLISGQLAASDYPAAANGAQGIVRMRLAVSSAGRVTDCEIASSSGSPELDEGTCKLVTERFVFQPAVDGGGRPVASRTGWQQRWWIQFPREPRR